MTHVSPTPRPRRFAALTRGGLNPRAGRPVRWAALLVLVTLASLAGMLRPRDVEAPPLPIVPLAFDLDGLRDSRALDHAPVLSDEDAALLSLPTDGLRAPARAEVARAAKPSLAKQLAKLEKKLAKAQAKQDKLDAKADDALDLADAAQDALDAANALPDETPAQQKAKAKAVASATKALAKADKKAAKLGAKLLAAQQKTDDLADDLDELNVVIAAQTAELSATGVAGGVSFSWPDVADAEGYVLWWSLAPGVDPDDATRVDDVSSPHVVDDLAGGTPVYALVAPLFDGDEGLLSSEAAALSAAGPYDPDWADVEPLRVIQLAHDGGLSDAANGARLVDAIDELIPGDKLVVGAGTWSLVPKTYLSPQGTSSAPVWIVAADGDERPLLTRPNADQNVLNVGPPGSPAAEYACIRGFEITGGSAGLRIGSGDNVWIDDNHIHHVGEAGITANQLDTTRLFITRNEIHDTAGYGEGMYLGANNGAVVMSHSVIALNHVHHTLDADQGDGIEVKQGSFGNWIVGNFIHDTHYPALLVYGTDGEAVNVIERNVLMRSDDNTLQVQGEALVRNNLVMGGAQAFQSGDHQGDVRDLVVVHNTFVNDGRAVRLGDWADREGMVFANNAAYSQSSKGLEFSGGSAGVTVVGNVVVGQVLGTSSGYVVGAGLADFVDADWDGSASDVTPAVGSVLLGAGSAAWDVADDLHGAERDGSLDAGCVDG